MKGGAGAGEPRGMANLVGIVLLVGLTLLGALFVVVIGSSALGSVADQTQDDVGEDSMREMSARIGSVADSSVETSRSFQFTDGVANQVELQANSTVKIEVVNESGNVLTYPESGTPKRLGTMVYERSDGSLVAYQGGGLWSVGPGQTQVLEEPQLDYDGTSVDFSLINVSSVEGRNVAGDREVVAKNDVAGSRTSIREVYDALEDAWTNDTLGGYVPVDMTVEIQGPFADGWAAYANESMTGEPASVVYEENTDTTRIEFQDLGTNSTSASGTGSGSGSGGSGGPPGSSPDPGLVYDSSSNALTVNQNEATIGLHSAEVGKAVEIDVVDEARDPMDVVFAIDETGSLVGAGGGEATDPDGERLEATKTFIDQLNATHGDRAGYVQFAEQGFPFYWSGLVPSHEGIVGYHDLTSSHGNVKADLGEHAEGFTNITRGIDVATEVHTNVPDPNDKRVMVVLTDGQNNDARDSSTLAAAERANETHGIVVHVVGLGDGVDRPFLEDVADEGGGEYHHVDDSDGLDGTFDDVYDDVASETIRQINRTETRVSAHQAVTESLQVNGTSNVNDPSYFADGSTTPVTDTISGLQEGDSLWFTLQLNTCDDYRTTDVTAAGTNGTYNHTRCAVSGSQSITIDNTSTNGHVVVRDGDPTSELSTISTEWWHSDPASLVSGYHDGTTFDLPANESIVALSVDDPSTGQSGFVLMHIEVDEVPATSNPSSTAGSRPGAGVEPISIGYSEIAVS